MPGNVNFPEVLFSVATSLNIIVCDDSDHINELPSWCTFPVNIDKLQLPGLITQVERGAVMICCLV